MPADMLGTGSRAVTVIPTVTARFVIAANLWRFLRVWALPARNATNFAMPDRSARLGYWWQHLGVYGFSVWANVRNSWNIYRKIRFLSLQTDKGYGMINT